MNKLKRNKPGTRTSEMWAWKLDDFCNMSGPFSVQEYIQDLIRNNPSDIQRICEPPHDIDLAVWQYEHIRQFIIELNRLIVNLQGVCVPDTCPNMRGGEDTMYLCASHKKPKECSAIDYMTHTLDNATSIIQSSRNFNTRISIPINSSKLLVNIVRRLYRLFAHTYFFHREIFMEYESQTHLCYRFTEFVQKFEMMPAKFFSVPAHAYKNDW